VMWIPGGFVYLAAVAYVFLKWLQHGDARQTKLVRQGHIAHGFILRCTPAARRVQ